MFRFTCSLTLVFCILQVVEAAEPSLTIYNQNFAVVRGTVPLNLREGENDTRFADITAHLEPSSVILRDPTGKNEFRVLEQNYRADAATQPMMLSRFEGKIIDFLVEQSQKPDTIVSGRIVRGGSARHDSGEGETPIIEVGGKLRFDLPGKPLFPKLPDESILQPELNWRIFAPRAAKFDAEIAYLSNEINWSADYNMVRPASGDRLQVTGWITINNRSGKDFENARIKLIAGEVNRLTGAAEQAYVPPERMMSMATKGGPTEKSFADSHLYTLPRPVTLRDHEAKQIEFIRAAGVAASRFYTYDSTGYETPEPIVFRGAPNIDPGWGEGSGKKVGIISEFKNSEANHLGMPLPKGRWRFYREDSDGQLEFTGENEQDHTARDETLRLFTGTAFDLAAERRQTDFTIERSKRTLEEAFEIKLRNHQKEAVEIRVLEHLNRWQSWEMLDHSDPFTKKSAHAVEFVVGLKPGEEKRIRYRVRYTQLPSPPL